MKTLGAISSTIESRTTLGPCLDTASTIRSIAGCRVDVALSSNGGQ